MTYLNKKIILFSSIIVSFSFVAISSLFPSATFWAEENLTPKNLSKFANATEEAEKKDEQTSEISLNNSTNLDNQSLYIISSGMSVRLSALVNPGNKESDLDFPLILYIDVLSQLHTPRTFETKLINKSLFNNRISLNENFYFKEEELPLRFEFKFYKLISHNMMERLATGIIGEVTDNKLKDEEGGFLSAIRLTIDLENPYKSAMGAKYYFFKK